MTFYFPKSSTAGHTRREAAYSSNRPSDATLNREQLEALQLVELYPTAQAAIDELGYLPGTIERALKQFDKPAERV